MRHTAKGYRQLCRDAWLAGLTHDELRHWLNREVDGTLFILGETEFARLTKQRSEATAQLARLGRLHGEGPGRFQRGREERK